MDQNQQRLAIAKICGHKDLSIQKIGNEMSICIYELCSGIPGKGGYAVPDYLNDLNAMAEAEKLLNRSEFSSFRQYLGNQFSRDEDGDTTGWEGKFARAIHGSAKQRGEGFLIAKGLLKI